MTATITQESLAVKYAQVAEASQQKLAKLQQYNASPQAVQDLRAAQAMASDSPLTSGIVNAGASLDQLKNLITGDSEAAVRDFLGLQTYNQDNPGSLAAQKLALAYETAKDTSGNLHSIAAAKQGVSDVLSSIHNDVSHASTPMDKLTAIYTNLDAFGGGIVKQLPNSGVAMAGMGAGAIAGTVIGGGPVGTVAGMLAGATLGNMGVGQSEAIQNLMAKQGIDQNNPQAIAQFLQNNRGQLLQDNAIKSGIIGLTDVATLGLTGAALNAPLKAVSNRVLTNAGIDIADSVAVKEAMKTPAIRSAILNDAEYIASKQGTKAQSAGLLAADMASEGVGEYVGQGVATGDWNAKDALLEAASSVSQSAGQHVFQKGMQAGQDAALKVTQKLNQYRKHNQKT